MNRRGVLLSLAALVASSVVPVEASQPPITLVEFCWPGGGREVIETDKKEICYVAQPGVTRHRVMRGGVWSDWAAEVVPDDKYYLRTIHRYA